MINKVLLAIYTPGYDVLVQEALDGTKRFATLVASSVPKALSYLHRAQFDVVILDGEFVDRAFYELGLEARKACPSAALIVILPGVQAMHPLLSYLKPDLVLKKPFDMPGLVEKIDIEVNRKKLAPAIQTPPSLTGLRVVKVSHPETHWLQDVNKAAQYLARLSMESSAQAALILRQSELWAYAGQLAQPEALELARVVDNFWANRTRPLPGQPDPGKADMARFTRLKTTGSEYMLYATGLAEDMILAMAFDSETPFGMMRNQAGKLAKALISSQKPSETSLQPDRMDPDQAADDDGPPLPKIDLKPVLGDVPPAAPHLQPVLTRPLRATMAGVPDLEELLASEHPTTPLPAQVPAVTPHWQLHAHGLEPASPAVANIVYASILIPRMPSHYLTGDVSARLGEWLPELCIAFGWRLEQISVRPDHMFWLVKMPPTTSPSYMMRVLRQHTSRRIFEDFPAFGRQNPSGDFWAPGYLVMSGDTPPPSQVIMDFIQQTRMSQANPTSPIMPHR
jgi:REP element-mobilizing transposase RayT/DNA-binding response OmpR family regulator